MHSRLLAARGFPQHLAIADLACFGVSGVPMEREDGGTLSVAVTLELVGVVTVVGTEGILGCEHRALELDEAFGEVRLVIGHGGRLRHGPDR